MMKSLIFVFSIFLYAWCQAPVPDAAQANMAMGASVIKTRVETRTKPLGALECLNYAREAGVLHPYNTVAVFVLETGWFRSRSCVEYNNLGGYMEGGRHRRYVSWRECVDETVRFQRNRGLTDTTDWFVWMHGIAYHRSDSAEYNGKVRSIVRTIRRMEYR